ncbi:molybdopterin-guanine dinucleotide biosynthesis protein A [Isoptericola jiangsuensis]|uniref:Molybdopterin-guanine dinucleotide biosynthesis protein A n=1 Tax=Isoptericola jiangsuensis TaxID=548579 RepID=A0A2A9F095_9MICO|nr:NTP transferase domain-containing protein [Isoptericola jiangsuensis]PFG43920.1 molybdopterin-guanine dinucleotide biosynthesis protein A [Isoptericola jiangsuensis]
MRYDAIVLAGGRATRLGGTPKPGVVVGTRRLLDRALAACADAERTVVVGPAPEIGPVPPGVVVTCEDPPRGGPVAGTAAGLAALARDDRPAHVLLLAVDVPAAPAAVGPLVTAAAAHPDADGVHLSRAGRAQWLTGLYRTDALTAAATTLAVHGAPVRRLVAPLDLVEVDDPAGVSDDVDTWEDVTRLAARRTGRPEEATP